MNYVFKFSQYEDKIFKLVVGMLFLSSVLANEEFCPQNCECKRSVAQKGPADFLKLKCGDTEKITELDEIGLSNIASEIIQFNLSNNLLTLFEPKIQLIALQN
ncbi:hypothetical protein WA026_021030, partial [Henosepilachna vigintioctopunctata]